MASSTLFLLNMSDSQNDSVNEISCDRRLTSLSSFVWSEDSFDNNDDDDFLVDMESSGCFEDEWSDLESQLSDEEQFYKEKTDQKDVQNADERRHDEHIFPNHSTKSLESLSTSRNVRAWLEFYVGFTSSAGNQEKLLKLIQWSFWMLGAAFGMSIRYKGLALWLQNMSTNVCYARYVTRLLGLPIALEGALSGSWANSSSNQYFNQMYQIFGSILAYIMVAYYPIEQIAFALWMKPTESGVLFFNWPAETWFYWSMRLWLAYLVADIVQGVIQCIELRRKRIALKRAKKMDNDDLFCDFSGVKEVDERITNVAWLQVSNLLYLLPSVHWSLSTWNTQPWLPTSLAHSLMWTESVVCLVHAIKTEAY